MKIFFRTVIMILTLSLMLPSSCFGLSAKSILESKEQTTHNWDLVSKKIEQVNKKQPEEAQAYYCNVMLEKKLRKQAGTQEESQMHITESFDPNKPLQQQLSSENFIPISMLPENMRTSLGFESLSTLEENQAIYLNTAKERVQIVFNDTDAGLGTNVKRKEYLAKTVKRQPDDNGIIHIGSKGCDLYIPVPIMGSSILISIAEAKLNAIIMTAEEFKHTAYQPIVNNASASSYIQLLTSVPFHQRHNNVDRKSRISYLDILTQNKIQFLPMIYSLGDQTPEMMAKEQSSLFTDSKGNLRPENTLAGSHGQCGTWYIEHALNFTGSSFDPIHTIHSFSNADNLNARLNPLIAGWMKHERIPIVMLSTPRTGIDAKGGLLGISGAPIVNGTVSSKMIPIAKIFELAQAKASKQEELFSLIGLYPDQKKYGEMGSQAFNTNIHGFNMTLLGPILQDLLALFKKEYEEQLKKEGYQEQEIPEKALQLAKYNLYTIASPDLIEKPGGQIEGAIASLVLNLNAYFETHKKAKAILTKHNVSRLLVILDTGKNKRIDFFTPIKSSLDFWIQTYTDLYTFNSTQMNFSLNTKNPLPLLQYNMKDPLYSDVQKLIEEFGIKVSIKNLTKLILQKNGTPNTAISFQNPQAQEQMEITLSGVVRILNKTTEEVCISELEEIQQLRTPKGIHLENLEIVIENDQVRVTHLMGTQDPLLKSTCTLTKTLAQAV